MPGATPVNQLNALPILTVDTFAVQGDITIVGTKIFKRWLPNVSGIQNTPCNQSDPRPPGTAAFLLTNWLDFSGMQNFTVTMVCSVEGVAGDLELDWAVYIMPAAFGIGNALVEPVPIFPGASNRNMTGDYGIKAFAQVGNITLKNLLLGAGPYPNSKIGTCSWSVGGISAGTSIQTGGLAACRLWFTAPTGADPCKAYVTVDAQS